jgi:hypothetical protein
MGTKSNGQAESGRFPNFFPPNCPPPEAVPTAQSVFRLVKTNPPHDEDFRPNAVTQTTRTFRDRCKACGLSVFTTLEDILTLRKQIGAFKKWQVAKGDADREDGVALHTPTSGNSHHSSWLYEGVYVAKKFAVVNAGDENNK